MATTVTMIKVGLLMDAAAISRWLVQEGDAVKKGEDIAEIETDKITYPVSAPEDGVVLKLVAQPGVDVPVGGVIAYIGQPGEQVDAAATPGVSSPVATAQAAPEATAAQPDAQEKRVEISFEERKGIRITPVARKLAEARGIDYRNIKGTGPGGRIARKDIEAALSGSTPEGVPAQPSVASTTTMMPAPPETGEVLPYAGMRRTIGERMSASWAASPRVTYHNRVDVGALSALRDRLNEGREKEDRVSYTDLLVLVCARALQDVPAVNSSLSGDSIHIHAACNIGVAVALDDGLIVPVVKDAQALRLRQISAAVRDLSQRARANRLVAEELQGGTFTISNLGMFGSVEYFSPIINQPEAAILGVGKITDTPVAIGGNVAVRPLMGLSLTADHRLVDGAVAARFLAAITSYIENPGALL